MKRHSIAFLVHPTRAVSFDGIRFGPSTMVARALTEAIERKKKGKRKGLILDCIQEI